AEGFFKKLESFLTDAKVSNLKTERLGKKPLAYQIAKQVEGEYAIYTFSASSDVPQSLLTMIKLEQDLVLRYLITRVKESKGSKGSKVTKGTKVEESEDKPEVEEKKVSLPGSGQAKVKVEAKVKEVKGTKVSLRDSVQAKGIKAKKK
ncbi:MAG: 30S ribosomal protein S6, partial [Candidatus Curtissbacteria bacterium]|nr:30S ribosomal protein S6 [Candidatus Curtissbacteria bacterium]